MNSAKCQLSSVGEKVIKTHSQKCDSESCAHGPAKYVRNDLDTKFDRSFG